MDDQDVWLKRADAADPSVRLLLLENRAQRSILAGRDEEADGAFREAAAAYDRDAKHSAAAVNNAALALLGRYAATGDPQHRRAALARLESSLRLSPDSAIVHGNLAEALGDSAVDEALGRLVDLRVLRPSTGDGATLFSALSRGPLRDTLRKALAAQADFVRARIVSEREAVLSPRKPDVAMRRTRWLDWMGDADGLRVLAERLGQSPPDVGAFAAEKEAWRAGRRDATWLPRLTQARALAETRVTRARASKKAPTLAAALILLADNEESLARMEPGAVGIDRAVAACREAVAMWPEAGLEETLADSLLLGAAVHAAESSPEWRARWESGRRVSSVPWLLLEASRDPRGGPAVAAVKARPELAEALALRRAASARQPEVGHLVLARAVGDAALENAARQVAARTDVEPELRLATLFDPDGAEAKGRLALFTSLGGSLRQVGGAVP
jgi:tetratricopeptide (TPR) repeat protein